MYWIRRNQHWKSNDNEIIYDIGIIKITWSNEDLRSLVPDGVRVYLKAPNKEVSHPPWIFLTISNCLQDQWSRINQIIICTTRYYLLKLLITLYKIISIEILSYQW